MKIQIKDEHMTPPVKWVLYLALTSAVAISLWLIYLSAQPEAQMGQQALRFMRLMQIQDATALHHAGSARFQQRYTPEALKKRFRYIPQTQNMQALAPEYVKGPPTVHVFFPEQKIWYALRLEKDISLRHARWELDNFCQVNRDLRRESRRFIRAWIAGDLSKARESTLGHVYHRQAHVLNAVELRKLRARYQLSQGSRYRFGKITFDNGYNYLQEVKFKGATVQLTWMHRYYARSGRCRYMLKAVETLNPKS